MYMTAISFKSENADYYSFLIKSKRKPSRKKIENHLKSLGYYLDYDEGIAHSGFENGDIEIGFIVSEHTEEIKVIEIV